MLLIELLKSFILGVVEGITEWLPISSTGHLILVDEFIKLNMSDSFKEMFNVVVQLGAIMAVVVLYFGKLNPFSRVKTPDEKKSTALLWLKVIIGVLPAAIIGLKFDDLIDEKFYNFQTVAITLIIYGILFIVIENKNKSLLPRINSLDKLSCKTALLIGVFQVLALIPGTSRSGATIIGGMLLGASRETAAEYTFFLAIPVMFGASLLKILKFGFAFSGAEIAVLITGIVVSFVVSVISIKFLMSYIKKHDFKFFGWYRIILGIVVMLYFAFTR